MPHMTRKARRRAGLTLVEAGVVLALLAITMGGFVQWVSSAAEDQRSRTAADRMQEILQASQQYMRANQTALVQLAKAGGNLSVGVAMPTPGGSDPGGPGGGLPSLQGGGFLPSTYVDVDTYAQAHRLVVKQVGTGANAHLEGMVVSMGGYAIPDRQIGRVAKFIGEQGGFMPSGASTITGVTGGWQAPPSAWTASGASPSGGHVMAVLSLNDNALAGDYLNRYDIGIPEANTMHTDVHFGGNKIDTINQICANGTATCVNDGSVLNIGPNITIPGYLHTGQEVNAGTSVSAGTTVTAGTDVSAGRNVYATSDISAGNNVYANNSVVANSDVLAGRNVTAGQDVSAGRNITAAQDAYVGRNIGVAGDAYVDGTVNAGTVNVNSHINVRDTGSPNTGCYGDNTTPKTADGSYICDLSTDYLNLSTTVYSGGGLNGTDTRGIGKGDAVKLGDLLPHYVAQYDYTVGANDYIPQPTCGNQGSPKVVLTLQQDSYKFMAGIDQYTYSYGRDYGGQIIGYTPGETGDNGIAVGQQNVYANTFLVGLVLPQWTYLARTVYAQPSNGGWIAHINGSYNGDWGAIMNAQTFCYYP